ncbi:gas vesicle protein [Microlunatus sp. Gsoil 973]|nr:gas vesicle protein [Microlunatus sp. Gsoil 973]
MTPAGRQARPPAYDRPQPDSLADLLERVLDKGVVLAGDIRVNLLDIELLTIKIRLLLVSVDKAVEMGIDWWRHDPSLSSKAAEEHDSLQQENARLRERLEALEGGPSSPDRVESSPADQGQDRTGETTGDEEPEQVQRR